jgi:thioredoxin reductase
VVVIGGGAAGLNGALMLARARRRVLVIDAGAPRNAPAAAVHGLLGRDGMAPGELLERGRDEVRRYGGQVTVASVASVASVAGEDGGFSVTPAGGRVVRARRLLVATGLADELPDVPGPRDRWGRDVVHCPYCHGWEVRAIGVLASGPRSVHQALLFRQLSDDVLYFSHGTSLTGPEAEQLAARGIRVVDGAVAALEIASDRITGIRLRDGTVEPREVVAIAPRMVAIAPRMVAIAPRMVARAGVLASLGLRPAEHPSGAGMWVPADPAGRTEVPGVWVAGNVTDLGAQVGAAAAAGAMAGAVINADLVEEETREAVAAVSL